MKNQLNKEENAIEIVVKILIIGIVALGILFAVGCEPEGCWDCDNYLVNGEYSEVCVQVDDSYCEY